MDPTPPTALKPLADHLATLKPQSVTGDSREVRPGAAFFAMRGAGAQSVDGHQFLNQAAVQGAVLCVGEQPTPAGFLGNYLQVTDSRQALAWAAAWSAGFASRELRCFGVTGTSGKTTTTYILESILKAAGFSVGIIGTVEIRYAGQVIEATHTTPGPVELQRLVRQMVDAGCTALVMEVSSHALDQRRTDFMAWDGVAFTNLSPEHLDYHRDMQDYFAAKARLFGECLEQSRALGKSPVAAVMSDAPWGEQLLARFSGAVPAQASMLEAKVTLTGIEGVFQRIPFRSRLRGEFNVSNLAVAATLAHAAGIPPETIVRGIENLPGVPGRLEAVDAGQDFAVCVDYAHKPDALDKVLRTLRSSTRGRIITVFGCGGDRDRSKRPVMGRMAAELSDHVVVTSDNPRTEDPDSIIGEIMAGVPHSRAAHVEIESDRALAIRKALQQARSGDFVLIAGKGHEDYQILGTQKVPFDDRAIALEGLQSLGFTRLPS